MKAGTEDPDRIKAFTKRIEVLRMILHVRKQSQKQLLFYQVACSKEVYDMLAWSAMETTYKQDVI